MASVPVPKPGQDLTAQGAVVKPSERRKTSGPPRPTAGQTARGGLLGGPNATISAAPAGSQRPVRPVPTLQSPEQYCREHAPSAYSVSDCVETKKQEALGLGVEHAGHAAHVEPPHVPGQEPAFVTIQGGGGHGTLLTETGRPVQNLAEGAPPDVPVRIIGR
jgi:hypothetical protein